jgi:hypothetical protein
MLVLALSYLLLVVLGQAGEQIGFDKKLKLDLRVFKFEISKRICC